MVPKSRGGTLARCTCRVGTKGRVFTTRKTFKRCLIYFQRLPITVNVATNTERCLTTSVYLGCVGRTISVPYPRRGQRRKRGCLRTGVGDLSLPRPRNELGATRGRLDKLFGQRVVFARGPEGVRDTGVVPRKYGLHLRVVIRNRGGVTCTKFGD